MGKILEYNDYFTSVGTAPQDNDLLFFGDYTNSSTNPTTYRLKISDLNKKRSIQAADSNGLTLKNSSGTRVMLIANSGNVAVGASGPDYALDVNGSGDTTVRVEGGNSSDAIIRLDQTSTQRASIGYDHSATLLKFNNSSTFDSNNHLVIDTSGNVGIGLSDPDYKLEVNGDIKAQSGSPGVALIAAKREIKGVDGTGDNELHLNRHSGGKIYFMRYTDSGEGTSNPVMWLDNTSRTVNIGNVAEGVSNQAKLSIVQGSSSNGDITPSIHAENYYSGTSGTNIANIKIKRVDSGASSQFFLNVDYNGVFNIADSAEVASATTVNFNSNGRLALGGTTFTRNLNVTADNLPANFNGTNNAGTKILIRNTANADTGTVGLHQSNVVNFQNRIAGTPYVNWMAGSFMQGSTNYFGIHYSNSNATDDGNVAFNGTLANNVFYLTIDGDANLKRDVIAARNVQAAAYYDSSGTARQNYCRGSFIQVFSFPFYAANQSLTPLFTAPYLFDSTLQLPDGTTADQYENAAFAAKAPCNGRFLRLDITFQQIASTTNQAKVFVYSGSTLPQAGGSASTITAVNAASKEDVTIAAAAGENGNFVVRSSELSAPSSGTDNGIDFQQGDYVMLQIDDSTGSFYGTATVTVAFDLPDNLGTVPS